MEEEEEQSAVLQYPSILLLSVVPSGVCFEEKIDERRMRN
jgi:hypothetical protein